MPNTETKRTLTILQYLRENTDDDHPVTIAQILNHLSDQGIITTRQTVTKDITALSDMGIDIVCDRSVQNQYFIASRTFSIPELKIMIDAVQAAKFISQEQTEELVRKIASLASSDQADALRRNLYISSAKREESSVLNTVDWLNNAINENRKVTFQYLEYNAEGQKKPKHDGEWYVVSPYILVWDIDNYYAVGFSERRSQVATFRMDKIHRIRQLKEERVPQPEGFDITCFCESRFLMFGDREEAVTLLCENSVMGKVFDRFGEGISITPVDRSHFTVTQTVMIGTTFFSWVFNYAGKIRITEPESVRVEFRKLLERFLGPTGADSSDSVYSGK
nr:WYL domain-containing transcriptional regulator [Clostridia bacterium]